MGQGVVEGSVQGARGAVASTPRFRVLPFAVMILIGGSRSAAGGGEDPQSKEYELKAVFLFNFVKFIDWPAPANAGAQDPITIGILGRDPFGAAVKSIEGKVVRNRKIAIRRFQDMRSLETWDLLFVPATEASAQKDVAEAMKGKPCLTVGETPEFTRQGGIIGFFRQDNKLRFEINLDTATANGLKVQSQLLKLARVVKAEESEKG